MKNSKKLKRIKKKMFDKLIGLKNFRISWAEYTSLYTDIQAKDKDEARKKWEEGITKKPIVDDIEFQDDSLDIEELK